MRRTESLAPYRSVAKRVTQCASLVTEPVRCVRACHPVPNEPISASKRARARCVRACQSVSEEPSQLARNHECVRLNSELWIKLTTPGIDPDSWAGLLLRDSMMLPRKSLGLFGMGWLAGDRGMVQTRAERRLDSYTSSRSRPSHVRGSVLRHLQACERRSESGHG